MKIEKDLINTKHEGDSGGISKMEKPKKRSISFTVYGKPIGKQRPKFARKYGSVMTYTPKETVNYENLVKISYPGGVKLEGAIVANIKGYFAVPKSVSKKQRERMLAGEVKYTKKIDSDNLAKSILDAWNHIAYDDDSQVCCLTVSKQYAEIERVEVELREI